MNKSYRYTLFTLSLAVVFIFGSMAGMNLILQARDRQLLTESGTVTVESPVRAWQEQGRGGEENAEESDYEGYVPTAEQMEEVIRCWEESMTMIVHNPVNGQMSMEEALERSEQWLVDMGATEPDVESYFISAMLGVAARDASTNVQLEPYYSSWIVQYSNESMEAILYLNAVTGMVWSAEITLFEDIPEEMPYEILFLFVELAGFCEFGDIVEMPDDTQAVLLLGDSTLCAQMNFWHPQTDYPLSSYGEEELLYYDQVSHRQEKVTILLKFTTLTQLG